MKTMRAYVAMLLVGTALVAAGCGGSGGSNASLTSSETPSTASLAPRDAGLWVSVDTDRSSSQWKTLDAVLARIPGAETLVDDAIADLGPGDKKLDFQKDIQPALGKELVVVLPAGASDPVLLAKPDDTGKLEALFDDAGTPPVKGERDGWTVFAQSQKALDAYNSAVASGTLADSDSFAKAMSGLPSEALVRAYADGKGIGGAVGNASGVAASALKSVPVPAAGTLNLGADPTVDPKAVAKIGVIGLAASAGDHIVRIDGTWQQAAGVDAGTYEPTLLGKVPGDALAALSFGGGQLTSDQIRSTFEQAGAKQLDQIQQTLGVSLDDLLHVADGQGVLYVRPGLLIPEVTAVVEPSDPALALATIDKIVAKLTAGQQGAKVTETDQGGIHWKQVTVSIVAIAWGRDGDRVVVTTQPSSVEAFGADGSKLVDSARFKTAAADVGLGDKTSGFGYVDVKGLTPLVKAIATAASSSTASDPTFDKLIKALDAIDSVAANTTADGSAFHFQAAVRVQ